MLDKRRARRHFERAAPTYERAAALQAEVGARLIERLNLIRLQPRIILDAGCGTGRMARALLARYPRANLVALDVAPGMLRELRPGATLWGATLWGATLWGATLWSRLAGDTRRLLRVCGDIDRLPLRDASVDMVCSNLALEWSEAPEAALAESLRVLARGGLLAFATLGPDTLRELRAAHPEPDTGVHRFLDMHDLGDMLVQAGYADPVMEMERITLTFSDFAALARELRASGCTSALPGAAGLRGRAFRRRLEDGYEAARRDGRLPASFEIVYGHAWKPEHAPRVASDGSAVVRLVPRRSADQGPR
jgi:malonyl-CoA O-methyltransferase